MRIRRRTAIRHARFGYRQRCEISPGLPCPHYQISSLNFILIARDVRIRQLPQLALERRDLLFRTAGDVLKTTRNLTSKDLRECLRESCFRNTTQSTRLRSDFADEVLSVTLGKQAFHDGKRFRSPYEERNSIFTVDGLPAPLSGRD